MFRKRMQRLLAVVLTGAVMLTQPAIASMPGTVTAYAEDASAEQTENGTLETSEQTEDGTLETSDQTEDETLESSDQTEDLVSGEFSDEDCIEEDAPSLEATPTQVNDAVKKFLDAMEKVAGIKDKAGTIEKLMTSLNSVDLTVGGAIAILQMAGIITDPTTESLQNIQNVLEEQNGMLRDISNSLNEIAAGLDKISSQQIIIDRRTASREYQSYYNSYVTNYMEPMAASLEKYKTDMNKEIRNWAEHPDGSLAAYYTIYSQSGTGGEVTQAYSTETENKTSVRIADNHRSVIYSKYTVELPAEYVSDALNGFVWDADSYQALIVLRLTNAVIKAADKRELKVGIGSTFYQKWAKCTDFNSKRNAAKPIAQALYNNQAYVLSCEYVNENTDFVNTAISQYQNLCKNMFVKSSGLDAYFQQLENVYAFEGEVTDQLEKTIDTYVLLVTDYGMFVETLASEDSYLTSAQKKAVQDAWINSTENLTTFKENNLTGKSNYCYPLHGFVEYQTRDISGYAEIKTEEYRQYINVKFIRYDSTNIKPITVTSNGNEITSDSVVPQDYMLVLYDQWKVFGNGSDFKTYLNQFGVNIADNFNGEIVTTAVTKDSAKQFPLTDLIPMTTYRGANHGWDKMHWFPTGQEYKVASTDVGWRWRLHENIAANTFNISNGVASNNKSIYSRAVYCHHEGKWQCDEAWYFSDSPTDTKSVNVGGLYYVQQFTTTKTISVLEVTPRTAALSDTADDETCLNLLDEADENAVAADCYTETSTEPVTKTEADWKNSGFDTVIADASEEKTLESVEDYVDGSIAEFTDKTGVTVSDAERTKLISSINQKLTKAEAEYEQNDNLQFALYCDPFHIYSDEETMTKLAQAVLPDIYKTDDGELDISVENMVTAATLEPLVSMKLSNENGKMKADYTDLVYVQPLLMVWDEESDSYIGYEISDDVTQSLGLTMTARLSTASLSGASEISVTGYDEFYTLNETTNESVDVQGSGDDSYVELDVSGSGLFSVSGVTGVYKYDDGWYYYKDGQIQYDYTGIQKNENGWWRIVKGKVDFTATGVYKNENGWWYCKDGKVQFDYTGIQKNQYGWWRIVNGKVDFTATGIYKNEYGWWRVVKGKVDFTATGVYKNENGWWYCKNGKVNFSYNGLASNSNGIWCIKNGKVDFSYTGIVSNSVGKWYCKGGKVQFTYTGKVTYNGRTYKIVKGKVK